jgi:hypothetical protein
LIDLAIIFDFLGFVYGEKALRVINLLSFPGIMKFILEDIGTRVELAFRWIYEEYVMAKQLTRNPTDSLGQDELQRYDDCLSKFIKGFIDHPEYREGYVCLTILIFHLDLIKKIS